MKPFIVVLALACSLGLVSVAVAIQLNPLAFVNVPRTASAIPIERLRPPTTTAPRLAILSRTIQLDEVLVVGEFEARRAPPRRHAAGSETVIHVVSAPCVDGAYRRLEAKRGVRLSCPATL